MERELNCENGITKTGRLSQQITNKLKKSKRINGNSKRNYEKAIEQEEKKSTRIKGERQHVVRSKKIHLNRPSKKLDQKRYKPFRISKDIGQGAF